MNDIDLNLLIALDTLLSVEEVGTAAARMGVTQSAMSHALRRLRQQFGDPLLVKGKGRMVKTAKAEALAKPLRRALLELQHALVVDATFAPKTSSRRMTIATNDYGDLILLPELIRLISRQAPVSESPISIRKPRSHRSRPAKSSWRSATRSNRRPAFTSRSCSRTISVAPSAGIIR